MPKLLAEHKPERDRRNANRDLRREIARALASNSPGDEDWAIRKLRSLGEEGIDIVGELVREEARYKRRARVINWTWLLAAVVGAFLFLTYGQRRPADYIQIVQHSFFLLYIIAALVSKQALKRKRLARILVERAGPDTVPLLLGIADRCELPKEFFAALAQALNAMNPSDLDRLTQKDRLAVRELLKQADEIAAASLRVLAYIGTAEDMPAIEQLARVSRSSRDPGIRQTAEETAASIRARLERQRAGETLLRPAGAEMDKLLRPVVSPGIDAAHLLRVAEAGSDDG